MNSTFNNHADLKSKSATFAKIDKIRFNLQWYWYICIISRHTSEIVNLVFHLPRESE